MIANANAPKGRAEILLVHGLGCQGSVWAPLQSYLDKRGPTCFAPTLLAPHRPNALPAHRAPDLGFDDFVSEVRHRCAASRRRTGHSPIVIGHSMGGLIAQVIAAERRCSKAVFLAPAPPRAVPNRSPWMLWCFANVLMSGDTKRYHKAWRRGALDVLFHPLDRRQGEQIYRDMVFEPGRLFADMASGVALSADGLRIPTLTVAAGRDRAVPAAVVRRIAGYYSSAPVPTDLRTYPESGHWLLDDAGSATLYRDLADWIEAPVAAGIAVP